MVNQNLIHRKLGYEKALESKKQILSLERDSLQIAKTIKNYHTLRTNELDTKIKLYNKIKSLLIDIRKLQKTLPKVEIEKTSTKKEEKQKKVKTKEKKYNPDIEYQLREIQEKLNALHR